MSYQQDFNLFIGGKTGVLKGLQVSNDNLLIKNLQNVSTLTAGNEITTLIWGDTTETDILIGTKEQIVKVYDSEFKAFSSSLKTKFGEGPIVGLTRFNNVITTCTSSGHIKVWKYSKDKELELDTKGKVDKMQGTGINSGIVATGGMENDLKLWDLSTSAMIFAAKNVKKNELDVAVPVWVTDIAIVPETDYRVVACSRYGHVRLYDTKAQRRPVVDFPLVDQSLMCLSLAHRENQVVVGSGTGYLMLVDFRMTGSNRVVSTFKGATGSIRQVTCSKTRPFLASVGLDSYFRLHNLDTKKVLQERFMQVKLNAVIMRSDFNIEQEQQDTALMNEVKGNKTSDDMDRMFDGMETIGAKRPVR